MTIDISGGGYQRFGPYEPEVEKSHYDSQLKKLDKILSSDKQIKKLQTQLKKASTSEVRSKIQQQIKERTSEVFTEKYQTNAFQTGRSGEGSLGRLALKETLRSEKRAKNVNKAASLFLKKIGKSRTKEKAGDHNSAEAAAMDRVQDAISEGNRVRDAVVLPTQILPSLKSILKGVSAKKVEQLAKVICREINEMTLHPDKYKGTSRRLRASEGRRHYFPVLTEQNLRRTDQRRKEKLHMDYDCWLEMRPNGEFRVLFFKESESGMQEKDASKVVYRGPYLERVLVFKKSESSMLGEGRFKSAYQARNLELVLKAGDPVQTESGIKRAISSRQVRGDYHVFVNTKESLKKGLFRKMCRGLDQHRKLMEILKEKGLDVNVVSPPKERLGVETERLGPIVSKCDENTPMNISLETEMEWYNCDLNIAFKKGEIPLTYKVLDVAGKDVTEKVPATRAGMVNALIEVGIALHAMHELGLVHRDINPSNILIKIGENNSLEGHVADFDLASGIGRTGFAADYIYWDGLGRDGIATPQSDCFGLVLSLGEVLFGRDFQKISFDLVKIKDPDNLKKLRSKKLQAEISKADHSIKDENIKKELSKIKTTSKDYVKDLMDLIETHKDSLSEEDLAALKKIKDTVEGLSMGFDLIANTIASDERAYQYFIKLRETNLTDYQKLTAPFEFGKTGKEQDELLQAKQRILEDCAKECDRFSMAQIIDQMKIIKSKLTSS